MNTRKMLTSGSDVERVVACIHAMQGGLLPSDAIPLVTRLLRHPSACVRAVALETLGEIEGDAKFVAKAAAMLESESNPTVRTLAELVAERWQEYERDQRSNAAGVSCGSRK